MIDCTIKCTVDIPATFCTCLETFYVPLFAISFHELTSVFAFFCFIDQVTFITDEDDWNLLCIDYLFVPVFGIFKAHLSRQICTQDHSIKRFEIRLYYSSHALLASCVEDFDLYDLTVIDLKPHALYVSSNCFSLYWLQLKILVQEFVD